MFGDVQRMECVERARRTDRQKKKNFLGFAVFFICSLKPFLTENTLHLHYKEKKFLTYLIFEGI
jgi:hypothetical protein